MSLCQAAVAEALEAFGRIDVLFCCCSEGELESLPTDLSQSPLWNGSERQLTER